MKTSEFYYHLPEERIAQIPLSDRTQSKLMVLHRDKQTIEHRVFRDLVDLLTPNDVLVLNDSRVIPARLFGYRMGLEKPIETLLLRRLGNYPNEQVWEVLLKPAKKVKVGQVLEFANGLCQAELLDILEDGKRSMRFTTSIDFETFLQDHGQMPLPPYIHETLDDPDRYQTVYSNESGSAAAPTAGLHFDETMLSRLRKKGIQIEMVTLHVGLGTFRPVKADQVEDHLMHEEYYAIDEGVKIRLNQAKKQGKRIIGVGTTSVRTLESTSVDGQIQRTSGWTDIFIYPPYHFDFVDSMITNFHLPESTLLMMIAAFAGKEFVLSAYQQAIEEKYRFFSFGDAMWIV